MSRFALTCLLLLSLNALHAERVEQTAQGFHWYTREEEAAKVLSKPKPVVSTAAKSPYERLLALRQTTLNKLALALLEPSFESTKDYMQAQMGYAKNNQQFVRHWQEVLLLHPELDNTLNFPTDNLAIALRNDAQKQLVNKILHQSAKRYGLILFYRGTSSLSQKFVLHLLPFVQEYGFAMISVSTDNQTIEGLPNPKLIPLAQVQRHMALEAKYLPALYFVDLRSRKLSPVSYGFVALDELKERLFDVVTQFKRFSLEGVGE